MTQYGKWFTVPVCEECKEYIDHTSRFYNGGICPNCGFDSNGTICSTINNVYRNVYDVKYVFFGLIPIKKFLRQEKK